MLGVGLVAIFLAIALVLATVGVLTTERSQVSRSMAALERMDLPSDMRAELDQPFDERVLAPARERLLRLGRRLTPQGQLDKMGARLEAAGSPEGWDVNRVLSVKVLAAAVGFLVGLALPVYVAAISRIAASIWAASIASTWSTACPSNASNRAHASSMALIGHPSPFPHCRS